MDNLLIVTTPILEKVEVKRYIGSICTNIVLGVNFFSDFAASFTDFFGGHSDTYQSKLDLLTDEVDQQIKAKAIRLGANAIIDYKLQFNEISGKGKQMFMVTATGTACNIIMPKQEEIKQINRASYLQVHRQYLIELYKTVLTLHQSISDKDWENIITNNLFEITPELTSEFFYIRRPDNIQSISQKEYCINFSDNYQEFITRVDKSIVEENIYHFIEVEPQIIIEIIGKLDLFSPKEAKHLIEKGELNIAIELLNCKKDYYTQADLSEMRQIITLIDTLPDKGNIQSMKAGLFSKKEEEMYICPHGHKNSKDIVYCANIECRLNIKGLTREQVDTINKFKKFTEALAVVLNDTK